MSNYKFKLKIEPEDIYNRLIPEQKEKFNNLKITDVKLLDDGIVEIECLALKDKILENPYLQALFSDEYITAI